MKYQPLRHILILVLTIACSKNDQPVDQVDDNITSKPDWFEVTGIDNHTYILAEPKSDQGNASYLLLGTDRAIMFDTGSGGNRPFEGSKIQYELKEITALPITLLLSHFHFDHNQNLSEFDHVAFPELPFLRQSVENNIYRFTEDDLFEGNSPTEVKVDEWWAMNTPIDLGGRTVELIHIPGHTDESVAIVDKVNKIALLGDFLYNGALFLFDQNDVAVYKESVELLLSNLDTDFKLYGAHGVPQVNYGKLHELNNFLDCIISNNCLGTSTVVWGYDVLYYQEGEMELVIFL